jgi:hypothetical protein
MFGVIKPSEVEHILNKERAEANVVNPSNLREQAISMVGTTVF